MSVLVGNPLLLDAGRGGYQIQRSLRFNSSDSAYLSRTPASAGNRKTFTIAFWIKRSSVSTRQFIFGNADSSALNGVYCGFQGVSLGGNGDRFMFGEYATSAYSYQIHTAPFYRDPSAWYHFVIAVDTTQSTAANRLRVYVNGLEVTTFSETSYPTQNLDTAWNTTQVCAIGRIGQFNSLYLSAYIADFHNIDGQALTPSSFAETNATTGQWVPKAYTGTYGTNGFRLAFADNSNNTATTLGKDTSGNGNNWTPNNLSVTAGAGNDSLVDTPTSAGTDTGVGGQVTGNYATLNPLDKGANLSLANGNLDVSNTATAWHSVRATIGLPKSGKYYWEYTINGSSQYHHIGVVNESGSLTSYIGQPANGYSWQSLDAQKWNNATPAGYGTAATANDVVRVAFDADNGSIFIGLNGSWFGSSNPATNTSPMYSGLSASVQFFPAVSQYGTASGTFNFGQRQWAYAAPAGFKALCDTSLPAPTIAIPATAFNAITYTGTGATLTPTSSLNFNPDLVWIKSRSAATDHTLYDSVRGVQARLESNNTDAEVTADNGLTAFNSNGFTLGTLAQVNTNAATYVAWAWDEALADGFDIVTYTGNGANRTIAHSLNVAPQFMIVKQRTTASATNWAVWHTSIANTDYLLLNSTASSATGATYWNSTSPTSSTFSLGTAADVNSNTGTYVAYLWSPVAGYSAFGSYVGNGNADGPFVYTGFRPRWILIKHASGTRQAGTNYNWLVYDTARNTYNEQLNTIYANASSAENVDGALYGIDALSNGFKIRQNYFVYNDNGPTYLYAAFAENPFQYSRAR